MSQPVPNIALLDRVREHIRRHPEQHDQGHWYQPTACGTTACVAGWAVLLGGGTAVPCTVRGCDCGGYVRFDGLLVNNFSRIGREILGLTATESNLLFAGENGLAQIDDVIADIKARAASLAAPELVAEAEQITAAAQLVSA